MKVLRTEKSRAVIG